MSEQLAQEPRQIEQAFEEFAKEDHIGKAMVITVEVWENDYCQDVERVPRPAFAHRIYIDERTDNLLIVRPDIHGSYKPFEDVFNAHCTRLR
jgi:hypothetical protein